MAADLCGVVYVGKFSSVCLMWLLKEHTSRVFTDFNDWTPGRTAVCVPWDLLLLTKGVKGTELTFAFHPDSSWSANKGFIYGVIVELV